MIKHRLTVMEKELSCRARSLFYDGGKVFPPSSYAPTTLQLYNSGLTENGPLRYTVAVWF